MCLLSVSHIITFRHCRGSRRTIAWVCVSSAAGAMAGEEHSALSSTRPARFYRDVMRVCRVSRMPDVFTSPPFPSHWFLQGRQGLNQSAGAPGTGAQQPLCAAQRSVALSGSVHLRPRAESGEDGADLLAGFTDGPPQADLGPAPSPQTTDLLRPATMALIEVEERVCCSKIRDASVTQ